MGLFFDLTTGADIKRWQREYAAAEDRALREREVEAEELKAASLKRIADQVVS